MIEIQTKEEETQKQEQKKCIICLARQANYNCPKCKIDYCSLECYRSKKHIQCSEQFYQDQVEESLKGLNISDDKDKVDMLNMLKRLEMENEIDLDKVDIKQFLDDNETYEEGILDKIEESEIENLSVKEIWEHLNPKEKEEFQNLIKNKNIEPLIQYQSPWWEKDAAKSQRRKIKKFKKIPLPNQLNHEVINMKITNCLYAYFIAFRILNNDFNQPEFEMIMSLMPTLFQDHNIININELHHYFLSDKQSLAVFQSQNTKTYFLAWSDVHHFLKECIKMVKKNQLVFEVDSNIQIWDVDFILSELYYGLNNIDNQLVKKGKLNLTFLFNYIEYYWKHVSKDVLPILEKIVLDLEFLLIEKDL